MCPNKKNITQTGPFLHKWSEAGSSTITQFKIVNKKLKNKNKTYNLGKF